MSAIGLPIDRPSAPPGSFSPPAIISKPLRTPPELSQPEEFVTLRGPNHPDFLVPRFPGSTVTRPHEVRVAELMPIGPSIRTGPSNPSGNRIGLAPRRATERERFDFYAAIVRVHGGQVNPAGRATVLGLRGISLDSTLHGSGRSMRYDDVFVVLTGSGRVREFRGSTHPGGSQVLPPDIDGDGIPDLGMIRPGNYTVVPNGPHAGGPSFHVRTLAGSGVIPGWRDTNHDGAFSDAERAVSERRGDALTEILFHRGGEETPGSIGCQTLEPSIYQRFVHAVGGPHARFSFTLVDALPPSPGAGDLGDHRGATQPNERGLAVG